MTLETNILHKTWGQRSCSGYSKQSKLLGKLALLHLVLMIDKGDATETENTLNGKVLIMSAESWDPWLTISEDNYGHVRYSGVMANILEFLQANLNFTTVLVRPPDGTWGAPDANGNWGGMVGQVNRSEADFALG